MRRIPAAGLRKRDGEGCAADAERYAEYGDRYRCGKTEHKDERHRENNDDLRPDARDLGADRVGDQAERHAKKRAGKDGNGDERHFVLNGKMHVLRYVDHQRAERDPRHETDVEI